MKRLLPSLLVLALAIFVSITAHAQERIVELSAPATLSQQRTQGSFNSDSDAGTIYYGSVPANSSSKPVLLFVHGYSSSASTWWDGNDMYSKAYNAGYRTAFVSLYPDRNSFENGQLLANMINTITSSYGVGKVAIVAHSKGGVDTDAALVQYGAYQKVSRVVTLGTPHFGTPLADLAQSGWVSWLSAVFGQFNDATYQLQTGAMSNFRSITDNNANNNFVDVRTIGAWGYGGALLIPGWYLNANGGGSGSGGNDGVVPYYSTKRPRAAHLLGGYGDSRTNLDHFEVAEGQYVWNYVNGQVSGASNFRQANEEYTNPVATIVSRTQVITTDKGQNSFFVEPGVSKVLVDIKQSAPSNIVLRHKDGIVSDARRLRNKELNEDIFMKSYSTTYQIDRPETGEYTIEGAEGFVAIVTTEGGISTTFTSDLNDEKLVYEVGETMNFNLEIDGAVEGMKGATVAGVMMKTSDLEGNATSNNEAFIVEFEYVGDGNFKAVMNEFLSEGVYNLSIEAQGRNFRKSTITSLAVVDRSGEGSLEGELKPFELLTNYPNPFSGNTKIQFEIKESSNAKLTVYDMFGRSVESFDLSGYAPGQYEIEWTPNAALRNGMYIYELNNGKSRVAKRMIYRK